MFMSSIGNIMGTPYEVDHDVIPAACFTQPEIAMTFYFYHLPTDDQGTKLESVSAVTLV